MEKFRIKKRYFIPGVVVYGVICLLMLPSDIVSLIKKS